MICTVYPDTTQKNCDTVVSPRHPGVIWSSVWAVDHMGHSADAAPISMAEGWLRCFTEPESQFQAMTECWPPL